jgi:hypothetical protein
MQSCFHCKQRAIGELHGDVSPACHLVEEPTPVEPESCVYSVLCWNPAFAGTTMIPFDARDRRRH